MKRDIELIRELLLKLEALDVPPGGWVDFFPDDEEIAPSGRSFNEIEAHLNMIGDAGLIITPDSPRLLDGRWEFKRLSPAGHDLVDSIRDPEVWKKTKAGAEKAGSWTIGILAEMGKAYAKLKIKDVLGLEL